MELPKAGDGRRAEEATSAIAAIAGAAEGGADQHVTAAAAAAAPVPGPRRRRWLSALLLVPKAVLVVEVICLASDAATRRRANRRLGRWSDADVTSDAPSSSANGSGDSNGGGTDPLETLVDYVTGKADFDDVAALSPRGVRSALERVDTEVLRECGAGDGPGLSEARQVVAQLRSEFARQLDSREPASPGSVRRG
eukprot:354314-Chlamydomonas_euryale.AAC.5